MPSSGAKEQTGMRETQFRNSPSEGKLGLILSQPDHRKHKNTFTMTGSSGFRGFTSECPLSVRDCLKFLRPPPVLPVSRSQNWVQEGQTPLPRASLSLSPHRHALSLSLCLPPSLSLENHSHRFHYLKFPDFACLDLFIPPSSLFLSWKHYFWQYDVHHYSLSPPPSQPPPPPPPSLSQYLKLNPPLISILFMWLFVGITEVIFSWWGILRLSKPMSDLLSWLIAL